MPAYLKITSNELKLPSLGACVPFPVSPSGNPWVLLHRERSPRVVSDSNSREGSLAELLIELLTGGTQARFAVGIVEF